MQQDKKHKESRADCVGQNYIRGTDEVCSVREGVVWSGPGHQPNGKRPIPGSSRSPDVQRYRGVLCGTPAELWYATDEHILILYLLPAAAAAFCCTLAVSVSMMCETPEGSSTTFVPSHFALFVNSVHSSLMSMSCNHIRDPVSGGG